MIPDLKTIWKNKKEIIEGVSNSIIKKQAVEDVANLRYSICKECPSLSTNCAKFVSECCNICGCSLEFKTRSMKSSCPADKWPSII
jgi:hypothetical protein